MAFFEAPRPPAPPQPSPPSPPWFGPPHAVLPGVVPLELAVALAPDYAVCVSRVCGYPTGFAFDLHVFSRERGGIDPMLFGPGAHRRRRDPDAEPELEPERLRFGVQFADARRATNLVSDRPRSLHEEPAAGIVLQTRGAEVVIAAGIRRSGSGRCPPPGQLAFVCEWPAAGIDLTRREIDAQQLLDAAEGATTLWPEP